MLALIIILLKRLKRYKRKGTLVASLFDLFYLCQRCIDRINRLAELTTEQKAFNTFDSINRSMVVMLINIAIATINSRAIDILSPLGVLIKLRLTKSQAHN